MANQDFSEHIAAIRKALHVGLASFGEIERVHDFASLFENAFADDLLKPRHPTGTNETIGDFADALMFLEQISEQLNSDARGEAA